MLSSLLKGRGGSPFRSSTASRLPLLSEENRAVREDNEEIDDTDYTHDEDHHGDGDEHYRDEEAAPLLPIFSAAHLDSLPVYDLTHSIRLLIVQRCETTLSWEQLRTPQVSQFLIKPIQIEIKENHFNRATLYALLANCLQFTKEGQAQPGNVGVLRTRAAMSELLAMRLLREYSTKELIDSLSYDFDPLSGSAIAAASMRRKSRGSDGSLLQQVVARTSTLEVAIRAQAKRFLAHPLVVQHLEAIWAGSIVFHNASDGLHRHAVRPTTSQMRQYGATHIHERQASASNGINVKIAQGPAQLTGMPMRRSVTLYDPTNASPFKLSRLRVPRYRQIFSTCSYAVLLGLFIAVLLERSLDITSMEILFWFWSAGFVLDELIAYNEQGFGLYIQSVWNAFDIGILLFFFTYYFLRLYGVVMETEEKARIAQLAYDVLASTAILLFPRLFSVLDHYRYFSQLLIAFRLMAQDLIAVFLLVAISCSGFFVAFSLAFNGDLGGQSVAFALFQIVMGFTPAAWNAWDDQNILGQILLAVFLIICHFLVVTILVSVLTNSFTAIVKNANEEHQFLFAINTISMVKSDALFSYVAPSNLLGWVVSPLRYVIPFRHFVRVNRTIIKATHFPILFLVYAYEKLYLTRYASEPAEQVERRGRRSRRLPTFIRGVDFLNAGSRLREPSAMTYHKDRALDEVFRLPFTGDSTIRGRNHEDRRESAVDDWMSVVSHRGGASPPLEQPRSILEQLETNVPSRRLGLQRSMTSQALSTKRRGVSAGSISIMSDTEDATMRRRIFAPRPRPIAETFRLSNADEMQPQHTDADGDDELHDEEEEEGDKASTVGNTNEIDESLLSGGPGPSERATVPQGASQTVREPYPYDQSTHSSSSRTNPADSPKMLRIPSKTHDRNTSVSTILFRPVEEETALSGSSFKGRMRKVSRASTGTAAQSPGSSHASPRKSPPRTSRARPVLPQRNDALSAPNLKRFSQSLTQGATRQHSMDALALDLASDIGDNKHNDTPGFAIGSFQTQFADAMARQRSEGEANRMSRIMLSRMNTLEESFRDMLREVKDLRASASASAKNSGEEEGGPGQRLAKRLEKKQQQRTLQENQTGNSRD